MNDFDYDVLQKKRTAAGARHMKRGSRSKRCSLPSDNLTPAQLKRRNGPVSTYKLDAPMRWDDFKAMPVDLQKQYLSRLIEHYHATNKMLGAMFYVDPTVVALRRRKLGVPEGRSVYFRGAAKVQRDERWNAFLRGEGAVFCEDISLDTAIPVQEFMLLSAEKQTEYIEGLINNYGTNLSRISRDLFCRQKSWLQQYMVRQGSPVPGGNKHGMTSEDEKRWIEFCKPVQPFNTVPADISDEKEALEADKSIDPAQDPSELEEVVLTPADTEAPTEAEPVVVKIPMLDMTELSATFNGWFTPEAFLGWISKLPIPEAEVKIRVSVTKRGEAV